MKALVAATCVALLASTGYYFWGESAKAQARDMATERASAIRQLVFQQAKAEPHDIETVMHHCAFARESVKDARFGDYAKLAAANCTAAGF